MNVDIYPLIDLYREKGGAFVEIEPGSLGFGKFILFGPGLKTCVGKEQYLNEWCSTHAVRFYKKTPAKYKVYTGE